jgi:hypothetical protein
VPGSAAFIIDTAGRKLRSELASAASMLVFAVWRRSAYSPLPLAPSVAVWSGKLRAHRATSAGAVQRCSTFVKIKRGSGYTQVVTISGIELAEKIKKGQFKTGKLGGCDATMTELWNAAFAA